MPAKKKGSTWKDILSNREVYGDDLVIQVKEGESYSLGDLRSYDEEHEGSLSAQLTAKEADIAAREQNLTAAQAAVVELAQTVEAATGKPIGKVAEELRSKGKVSLKQVAEATGLEADDPLLAPIAKQVNELKSHFEARESSLQNELKQVKSILGQAIKVNLDDHYARQFSTLKVPKGAEKDVTLKGLLDYAEKKGLKDEVGRYDIHEAFARVAAPHLEKDKEEQIRKDERDRILNEQRMASIPRPGRAGQNLPKAPIDVSKSHDPLGDAFNAAMQDEDLWNSLASQIPGQA